MKPDSMHRVKDAGGCLLANVQALPKLRPPMRLFLVACLLFASALAGCAEDAPESPEGETTQIDEELVATDDTGVIRGVVVDPAIIPIAGVTVTLNTGEETVSLEDGSFGFSDLEPGSYFMTATKPGYDGVQSQTDVEAGVALPPVVRIQMLQNLSATPYIAQSQFKANLLCGLSTPAISFGCTVLRPSEPYIPEVNSEVKEFEVLPTFFQTEMYWTSTQSTGDSLILDLAHCCDNDSVSGTGTARGTSPLTAFVTEEEMAAKAVLEDGLEIRVFPWGNDAIRDASGQNAGVILDQEVDWISHEFYNFAPTEGWTFIADGAHPLPS